MCEHPVELDNEIDDICFMFREERKDGKTGKLSADDQKFLDRLDKFATWLHSEHPKGGKHVVESDIGKCASCGCKCEDCSCIVVGQGCDSCGCDLGDQTDDKDSGNRTEPREEMPIC